MSRECGTKLRYRTSKLAWVAMWRYLANTGASPAQFHVYRCKSGCGFYHVGHRPRRYLRRGRR